MYYERQWRNLFSYKKLRCATPCFRTISFSIQVCFYQTSNAFYFEYWAHSHKTVKKFDKNKGKVTLNTFGHFAYFSSYLQKKLWMETRLSSIFKNANSITLAKIVLENHYKVAQDSRKGAIFKWSVHFSKIVQFYVTFNV